MTDPVISAASEIRTTARPGPAAQVRAVETVGGVLTDLVELAERLPVPPGQAEAAARILDRLAEEIAEAAGLVRSAAHDGPAGPER
jgi:hypothetical protein